MTGSLYAWMYGKFPSDGERILLDMDFGRKITWTMAAEWSARYADFLYRLGLKQGDRIATRVEKSPEFFLLYLACLRGGLILAPINPATTDTDLEYLLRDCHPAMLVVTPKQEETIRPMASRSGIKHILSLGVDNNGSFAVNGSKGSSQFPIVECHPDDPAAILYTSGSTGKPKGVVLTHYNLLSNAQGMVQKWGFTDKDIVLHTLPVFDIHGLFSACHCALLSGAGMIWMPSFEADRTLMLLPRATVLTGTPLHYGQLLQRPGLNRTITQGMRLFLSGSAPLTEQTYADFLARTGHSILEYYGTTETGIITGNSCHRTCKPGTVGTPCPGTQIRIAEPKAIPGIVQNNVGEVQVHGPGVTLGYQECQTKGQESLTKDGWFRTGDMGAIDPDGCLRLVGRIQDVIISKGLAIFPAEIETALNSLDGIEESAVISVKHPAFGEGSIAIVRLARDSTLTEALIMKSLQENLDNEKIPERIFPVPEIPHNTTGTILKDVLRKQYDDLFLTLA